MPNCPVCNSTLLKPPDDVQDWFRCQTCGTPLQISTTVGKIIFCASIAILFISFWAITELVPLIPLIPVLSRFSKAGFNLVMDASIVLVSAIYAILVRLLWKSSLFQPRPCDPYSLLNLSDDRKKMRGRY